MLEVELGPLGHPGSPEVRGSRAVIVPKVVRVSV